MPFPSRLSQRHNAIRHKICRCVFAFYFFQALSHPAFFSMESLIFNTSAAFFTRIRLSRDICCKFTTISLISFLRSSVMFTPPFVFCTTFFLTLFTSFCFTTCRCTTIIRRYINIVNIILLIFSTFYN